MEETDKSPIIDRLCNFITFSGLSNSQFADKAGIPRPSLSQMLHGRNKSINNQVLEKLNDAFPELNVLWLLFGQGDMLTVSNIEFSERQKALQSQANSQQNLDFDSIEDSQTDEIESSQKTQSTENTPIKAHESRESPTFADIFNHTVAGCNATSKKVTSIIVLYSDNSFETFLPSNDPK